MKNRKPNKQVKLPDNLPSKSQSKGPRTILVTCPECKVRQEARITGRANNYHTCMFEHCRNVMTEKMLLENKYER